MVHFWAKCPLARHLVEFGLFDVVKVGAMREKIRGIRRLVCTLSSLDSNTKCNTQRPWVIGC